MCSIFFLLFTSNKPQITFFFLILIKPLDFWYFCFHTLCTISMGSWLLSRLFSFLLVCNFCPVAKRIKGHSARHIYLPYIFCLLLHSVFGTSLTEKSVHSINRSFILITISKIFHEIANSNAQSNRIWAAVIEATASQLRLAMVSCIHKIDIETYITACPFSLNINSNVLCENALYAFGRYIFWRERGCKREREKERNKMKCIALQYIDVD